MEGLTRPDMASHSGTWNRMQRTMLQWDELHPYNAVHGARLAGPPDFDRLQNAVNRVLEVRGLTGLTIDSRHRTFRYAGGPANCQVERIPFATGLAETVQRQLNLRFPATGAVVPFRFLVAAEANGFCLLLAYFHPVADADSIVRLMQDIAAAYRDPAHATRIGRWDVTPPRPDLAILHRPALALRWLASLPRSVRGARCASRPAYRDPADGNNGFRCFTLGGDALPRLLHTARAWNVTLNDLFLAALMLAIAPEATKRLQAPRRRQLSLGCIVNLRRDLGLSGAATFGLLLGSFRVLHTVPDGIELPQLARAVGEQTARIKRDGDYLATGLKLAVANLIFSRAAPDRRPRFYPKHHPLWAGITNLNVDAFPAAGTPNAWSSYFRGVSTGPATPLVLSVTTAGGCLEVGLSHRTTVYLNSQVDRVQDAFQQCLERAQSTS